MTLPPGDREAGWVALPIRARIEAMAACQLKCPSCPTASGAIRKAIVPGRLTPQMFARFLDQAPSVKRVELSNYGEVFQNPELAAVLRLAATRGITISMTNGANLNHLEEGIADLLVRAGVAAITCSIDGATQDVYARYRVGGDLARVLANIDAINRAKRQFQSLTPALVWQFVIFGHNEHEIGLARAMADARGMKFQPKLSWDETLSPIRDAAMVRTETGLPPSRTTFRVENGHDYAHRICHQLWTEPQFNWNGDNLGCCRNFWGDFGGNVLTDGLEGTFNGEKMRRARRMLLGDAGPFADIPCATCDLYLARRANGEHLTLSQITGRAGRAEVRTLP